ncbi:DUF2141 domain-containing protein [Altererythrobacter salegens]|uniref:DUF2141 domain-containing protein n=1 Tax=Croceibacterium salegens TaxID=1737568 RepID=A0A6I4SX14_9SPHN|nr:DUF2141 domain-containing protein [Croceibacterium salegens]MXO59889.1 DUF2141 domain-containing protein [Croceibacterium salegens]
MSRPVTIRLAATGLALAALAGASFAGAQGVTYRNTISNNPAACRGEKPSVLITVSGIKASTGTMRVQLYRSASSDWLEKGKWINRIETPAKAGQMTFCMPVPAAGTYGIAIRHDINGNGETDMTLDGGGMSNNPSLNLFNMGRPSYKKTAFEVGNAVKPISITMRYY